MSRLSSSLGEEPGPGVPATVRQALIAVRWLGASLTPVARGVLDNWPETAGAVIRAARDTAAAAAATGVFGADHPAANPVLPATDDRRFRDRAWTEHRYFHLLQQAYLLSDRLAHEVVDSAGLSAAPHRRAHLAVQLLSEAVAPTNTVLGNPEVLRRAVRSRGRSLLRGMRNASEDVRHNHGRPRQVPASAFALGRDLAASPGRVVLRTPLLELIQYEPQTPAVHRIPLLISPPWVNKYYGLDLSPGRSLVEWAIKHGHTVFAISYRNPGRDLRDVTLADYMLSGLLGACEAALDITGSPQLNLLGACNGGTLVVMLQAWLAAGRDRRVRSTTLLNTYVDFSDIGVWGALADDHTLAAGERIMTERGYVEGHTLALLFDLLRGKDLYWHYFARNWLMGESPPPFDLLAWNNDTTNVTAAAHHDYVHDLALHNKLASGDWEVAGRTLRLDRARQDAFVVAARNDHIVPWPSAYSGARQLAGDVRFCLSSGGHVAGVVNPPHPKASHWSADTLPDDPARWLDRAQLRKESWWLPWVGWLSERAGERAEPPPMGSDRYPAGAPAPGSYIHL
ncbi:alpha/beta fold hydrolase [Amycolatopsis sp. NPDC051716]|uniref:PHA/PHB synthase family protein n=1 Tax=Amycolatopsis sp. NPDC051716 TaxID=3155804 RepID=UPI003425BF28